MKSKLPVMEQANTKSWVTRQFFIKWIHEVFTLCVKKYLQENKLAHKIPSRVRQCFHSPSRFEEFNFIQVKYLPPNTTPLI